MAHTKDFINISFNEGIMNLGFMSTQFSLVIMHPYHVFKSGTMISPFIFVVVQDLFKICLVIQGLLRFHTNFRIIVTTSVKSVGISLRTVLNLKIASDSMGI